MAIKVTYFEEIFCPLKNRWPKYIFKVPGPTYEIESSDIGSCTCRKDCPSRCVQTFPTYQGIYSSDLLLVKGPVLLICYVFFRGDIHGLHLVVVGLIF
jgi:hypothetical protein